ncbi:MAG TPA: FAD-binding oxidoreductase [Actinomycetales bacterium]|nr:FAD-binding oxidoreductase [Actinomycetales bacterium]
MATRTLDEARSAVKSACGDVRDAGTSDDVDGVTPSLVARPASTEQVADVMRAAASHGLAVVPRGHGTKLSWGRPPERADLVVDLSRMDAVLDHASGDLIVEAQAGAGLADVQRAVAIAGQRLSVDETVPGATVGGTLATAASGPGRLLSGTVRDLLIGVTVVRADGVVAHAGGRVVKNVAGYDLGKLVVGSFGTLAVVTEAVFRLHPIPAARSLVTRDVATPAEAQRLVQAVLHAQVVPSAVEIRWGDGRGAVSVLLEGRETGVRARTAATVALLGDGATTATGDLPDDWSRYPWHGTPATALKATFAVSGLERVLADATAGGDRIDLRGSAGAGVTYLAVHETDVGAVAALVERLRRTCASLGGALVVLDGPADVKAAVDSWGPVPALDLMRRVKHQFDPARTLSPGRFVGGI